jgi:4'-phosphopantetheinyl transferase
MNLVQWHGTSTRLLNIAEDEVHVWVAALDLPEARADAYRWLLSDDEQQRAERFRFRKDRQQYVVTRGILRSMLGRYLQIDPARLHFQYSTYGKPQLTRDCGGGKISFNLSHSKDLALFAIARGRNVGVDVEHLRSDLPIQELAERFFSPRETEMLNSLPDELRFQAFYTCWTRKESYLKARGEGLMIPSKDFDVSLAPSKSARLQRTLWDPKEASRWMLYNLEPHPDYVATLTVRGQGARVKCRHWIDQ